MAKKTTEQSVHDALASLLQEESAKQAELQKIKTAIASLKAYLGDVTTTATTTAEVSQSKSSDKSVPSRVQKDTLKILQFLDGTVQGLDEVENFCRDNGITISRPTLTARLNYYRNDFGLIDSPDIGKYTLTKHGSEFVHKKTKNSPIGETQQQAGSELTCDEEPKM